MELVSDEYKTQGMCEEATAGNHIYWNLLVTSTSPGKCVLVLLERILSAPLLYQILFLSSMKIYDD